MPRKIPQIWSRQSQSFKYWALPLAVFSLLGASIFEGSQRAYATVYGYSKSPPYDSATTQVYSSTGTNACNPPENNGFYEAAECASATSSNGMGNIYALAYNKALPETTIETYAQASMNT